MHVATPFFLTRLVLAGLALLIVATVTGATNGADPDPPAGKLLRHVVLLKFKESSSPADVERIIAGFRALPAKIPQIKAFEWGTDVSPEGKSQGLTHCFLLTFATAADRDAYLPHPAHQEFVSLIGPHIDKLCVVDYWSAP